MGWFVLILGVVCSTSGTFLHKSPRIGISRFGISLFFIGTLLAYYGTDLKNHKSMDELLKGKDILIAQNNELNNKIQTYQTELESKQKQIDELGVVAKKDIYRPLSSDLRRKLVKQIAEFGWIKKVSVNTLNGNNTLKQVRDDLISLLRDSGVDATIGFTENVIGEGLNKPEISVNSRTRDFAGGFLKFLHVYLKTKYVLSIDDGLERGMISLTLSGSPRFSGDGSVEFQ